MWFLLNPPNKAAVQILSIDNFKELVSKYHSILEKQNARDPRYTSALNHLRFYLPDVFPLLNKIVLLDHDVVVQRDLTGLWSIDMNGKVNGAVGTCHGDPSYRQMDMYINFSDPSVTHRNDIKECTWAFGMNLFDLQEWRRKNLTTLYHKLLQLVSSCVVLIIHCFSLHIVNTPSIFVVLCIKQTNPAHLLLFNSYVYYFSADTVYNILASLTVPLYH